MRYKVHDIGNGIEVVLYDSFTFRDHDAFFEILSNLKKIPQGKIIFNLSYCEFLDSGAIGMLSLAYEEAFSLLIDFYIKGAKGKVKDLLLLCFKEKPITMID